MPSGQEKGLDETRSLGKGTAMSAGAWVTCAIGLCAAVSLTGVASAEQKATREPIKPQLLDGARAPVAPAKLRTNEFFLDRYDRVQKIMRKRTEGKTCALFTAEPQLIDKGAVMLIEIKSVSKSGSVPRWRCIAVHDVAECLGVPVKIAYLPSDDRIVLTATLKPASAMTQDVPGLASR
jgi:hypothetical protein